MTKGEDLIIFEEEVFILNRNQNSSSQWFCPSRLSAAGLSPGQVAAALAVVGGARRALGQQGRSVMGKTTG